MIDQIETLVDEPSSPVVCQLKPDVEGGIGCL